MPHLDDTGGFFIVAIDKVGELPEEMEAAADPEAAGSKDGKKWNESNRVAPVIAVENAALVESMRAQYGLDDAKAGISAGLMTRRAGEQDKATPKRLYFVSGGARKLLDAAADGGSGLQVVAAGVKAFERQAAEGAACDYRVTQEGLDALLPHLEKQVVRAAPREIEAILCRQQGQPPSKEAADADLLRPEDAPEGCWEKDTLAAMKNVTPGCVILVTRVHTPTSGGSDGNDGNDGKGTDADAKKSKKDKKDKKDAKRDKREGGSWSGVACSEDLAVACWYGHGDKGKSLSVLASKAEGSHLLYQLRESMTKK
jgi:hypothetical protein